MVAIFLLVVGALVPWMAWKSRQTLGDGPLPMPRRLFFQQTIIVQLVLFALAAGAIWPRRHSLFALPPSPLRAWLLGLLFLAAMLALMAMHWPLRDDDSKARLARILPRERGDYFPYFVLCAVAGVSEEAVYRGALAMLLTGLTGSAAAAVAVASLAFALAHVLQGWRNTVVIFFIALAAHAVVLLGGSLLPAMAAHALYDAVAGVLMPRWYEREKTGTVAGP